MPSANKPAMRRPNQLRPIRITRGFTRHAPGSVLYESGQTRVLCTACFINEIPSWRKDSHLGWVTAEYSMLPSSTTQRKPRSRLGTTDSRGTEIQRFIGRVLRSVVDFAKLGENTIYLDCDVLQADGGTRTAAISGAYIAMVDAVSHARNQGWITQNPLTGAVAAVSVGIIDSKPTLDLDYAQDSTADVDMNIAMTNQGKFIEIQGTAEHNPFDYDQLDAMLKLARKGIRAILKEQRASLKQPL